MDDYPLRFGGLRLTGPLKYFIVGFLLLAVTLCYVQIGHWFARLSADFEGERMDDPYLPDEDAGEVYLEPWPPSQPDDYDAESFEY